MEGSKPFDVMELRSLHSATVEMTERMAGVFV